MVIKVVCGVIVDTDKVLCVQRSESMTLPLKWEFPGGKIEQGETSEECLNRELKEELNIEVSILRLFIKVCLLNLQYGNTKFKTNSQIFNYISINSRVIRVSFRQLFVTY
jgi:8-oxo-dGTP diphosphatase